MSKRRDVQSLAEELVRTIDPATLRKFRKGEGFLSDRGPAYDRQLTPAEARQIRAAAAQERKERRDNSMLRLLRAQWMPWLLGGIVFAVGAGLWLLRWLSSQAIASTTAVGLGIAVAWIGWMAGNRNKKWRVRAHIAAFLAAGFLLYCAATGPTWDAPAIWIVLVVLSSLRWWQAHRPAHPLAPSRKTVPVPKAQSIPLLWAENVGAKDRSVPGSVLSNEDRSRKNCVSYTINAVPGKQSITYVISQLALIAGGLHTPIRNIVLEPHEDEDPNHLKLTIVQHSPIAETVVYRGARIVGDRRNMIEIGPYGDGDGYGRWRMWQPGEQPMTGSWLSGLIIAGTGIGKSRLMELLAAGYMASGCAIPWFNDPQGGASSPALQEYADWYTSAEGTAKMISALERAAAAREKENSVMKWSRFDPSPERPGIVAFFDEGHVAIAKFGDRLEALARKTQKVGIGIIVLTQGASLESLGKDILRACLMANVIVMKTNSNQTKNLLPGLPVDPEMLPKIPGFGYIVGTDGSRTAPLRAECQDSAEYWFKRYAELVPPMDALTANAIGEDYELRRAAAAEEQEANRLYVEQLRAGGPVQPILEEQDDEPASESEPVGAAFQVVQFPAAPVAPRPQDRPARERILIAVAQGVTRTEEIKQRVGLGKTQLHDLLKDLVDKRELEQPTRGVYVIAGSASPPER